MWPSTPWDPNRSNKFHPNRPNSAVPFPICKTLLHNHQAWHVLNCKLWSVHIFITFFSHMYMLVYYMYSLVLKQKNELNMVQHVFQQEKRLIIFNRLIPKMGFPLPEDSARSSHQVGSTTGLALYPSTSAMSRVPHSWRWSYCRRCGMGHHLLYNSENGGAFQDSM